MKQKNIYSIFIMTDDYKAIVEAKEYLMENELNHNLFYLTKKLKMDTQNSLILNRTENTLKQNWYPFLQK